MSIRLITPTLVANAKPRKKRYEIHDRDLAGFRLLVLPSGRKSYRMRAYCNGEDFFETIGDAGEMSLCEARSLVEARLAAFGNTKHDSNTPFEVVAEVSFYYRGRLWKPITMRSCRINFTQKIQPYFKGKAIGSITCSDVEDWFLGLAETPGSANRCLPILSGIMRTAEDLGYIEEGSNPARGIRRYKTKPKERFLTNDEMARLGAVLKREAHAYPMQTAFIRFMTLTGCRGGELLSLKWDYYIDSNLYLPDSKTGPKTVFLSTPARKLLAELSKCNKTQWVFALNNKQPSAGIFNTFWYRIRAEVGISDVRLHDLRHNYASVALRSGENLRVIGMLLGHVDAETTLRYAHLDDATMHSAVNKVAQSMTKRTRRTE